VEKAYQRTKDFDKLSFLYLAGGSSEKLTKMQKIAESRGDAMSKFHNALYTGDVETRISVMREAGLGKLTRLNAILPITCSIDSLAYLTTRNHGMESLANEILSASGRTTGDLAVPSGSKLGPPKIVATSLSANWPTIAGEENYFERAMLNGHAIVDEQVNGIDGAEDITALDQWAAEDAPGAEEAIEDEAWDLADEDDKFFDLDAEDGEEPTTDASRGVEETELWKRNSPFAADHVAAGSFESAMLVWFFYPL
jgi:coatomer protein complex subunit alpha (xenin)